MQSSLSDGTNVLPIDLPVSSYRHFSIQDLINRLVVQFQQGCGNPACSTPTCASARSRLLSRPVRNYTTVSARAMAVVLASEDNPEKHLCPHLPRGTVPSSTHAQEKVDPKSVIQQLCNTKTMREFHLSDAQHAQNEKTRLESLPEQHQNKPEASKVGISSPISPITNPSTPDASSDGPEVPPTPMTCSEIIELKNFLMSIRPLDGSEIHEHGEEITFSFRRLSAVLADFTCLSQSFPDDPTEIWSSPGTRNPSVPSIRVDQIFRDWSEIGQDIIFNSIWAALRPIFESPFTPSPSRSRRFLTLPPKEKNCQVASVIFFAIHALTASIPRAQRETWHVVWSTIINGRAYGKQRHIHDDLYLSPWLHILDAFEHVPALRMAKMLIRVIGARTCLEDTLLACGAGKPGQEPELKAWEFPNNYRIRRVLLIMLVREEQAVRNARFKTIIRDESRHGKHLLGTTSLVWLEWLRKCFLKEWDGKYQINRWGVAGQALELIEDLWKNKGKEYLDIPEDLFATPVVFNHLDVEKAVQDWLPFKQDSNTRHLFSFKFLFSTRALTLFVRTAHHTLMRGAYGDAEAVWQMRRRNIPRISFEDAAYLDRRLRAAQDHYLVLRINRRSILSDAFDQLWHREKRELMRPLRIRMGVDEGEIGHDLGGVQIEFFKLCCQEAFKPGYSLFTIDPQTRLAWFQPASLVPLYKFQLLGLLFALAVWNGITLPVSFPLAFYKKLLFQACDETDLREGWPDITRSLRHLREHKGSVEEDFARDYVFSFTANGLHLDVNMDDPWDGWSIWDKINSGKGLAAGRMKIIRAYPDKHHPEPSSTWNSSQDESSSSEDSLTDDEPAAAAPEPDSRRFGWPGWNAAMASPDEEPAPVTNDNRQKYIRYYAKWVMDWSIRPQFMSFAKGFYALMNFKPLTLLSAEQLRTLVEGHNHLDINALQRATTYQTYTSKSPVIRWFWEVVKAYPQEKQKQLLEFVTASSRVPVNGAESLTFVIERSDAEPNALPGSSTCFGTLRLPEYESKELLRKKLDIALEHSLGFGQA